MDLEFQYRQVDPLTDHETKPIYSSPLRDSKGRSRFELHLDENGYRLIIPIGMSFIIHPEKIICCSLKFNLSQIEHYLFGIVLALWLEMRGTIALHASAIEIDDRAAIFLASSRSGKSTLAASFLQAGASLITDNILPVIFNNQIPYGFPGFPGLRLMPDEVNNFLIKSDSREFNFSYNRKLNIPVGEGGFGSFARKGVCLASIYLPSRYEFADFRFEDQAHNKSSITFSPLTQRDAVIELMRYSFLTHTLDAIGLAPDRLGKLAKIAQKVPVRRLRYPNGYEYLEDVRNAVGQDLAAIR